MHNLVIQKNLCMSFCHWHTAPKGLMRINIINKDKLMMFHFLSGLYSSRPIQYISGFMYVFYLVEMITINVQNQMRALLYSYTDSLF